MQNIINPNEPLSQEWLAILEYLSSQKDEKKNPSKLWLKELTLLLKGNIGMDIYEKNLGYTLSLLKQDLNNIIRYQKNMYPLLKGLLHSTALFPTNMTLIGLVEDIGVSAFSKGSHGLGVSNDCLFILSNLDVPTTIASLGKLRVRVKLPKIQSKIATLLNNIGKKNGKSADELEELSIGSFNLDNTHQLSFKAEDWVGTLNFAESDKSETIWKKDNKVQKSVPKEITNTHKTALKELSENIKEIKEQLVSQCFRIESLFLKNTHWSFDYWTTYYLNHSLIGILSKKLIWEIRWADTHINVLYKNGHFIDTNENIIINIPSNAQVTLWHPINSSVKEIKSWRTYLTQNRIVQPFKQAFREVYVLTDAEIKTESYSNRYAAHIIKVGTYLSRSRNKGWTGSALLMDNFALKIPFYDIKTEYWIQSVTTENDYIYGSGLGATDQVRFYKNKEQINLNTVPKIVFSEVMRDIDIFIGASSITNNPYWTDTGSGDNHTYWHKYSFGDLRMSGKIRYEVLSDLLPMLPIAPNCTIEGNFLRVVGKLRTYKIHIGSGNILMEPNDQYLCIVPDTSKRVSMEKVFLPFEGDETLSIIISKAFLLAADDKITDTTITSQIN